jgi:hypothetical protein
MNTPNGTEEAERLIDCLVRLAHYVEPVEHADGRIKLRVPLAALTGEVLTLLGEMEKRVASFPGVKKYEVSLWFRSATIVYDPSVLSPDLWNDLCSIRRDAGAEEFVRNRLRSVFKKTRAPRNSE